MAAGSEGSNLVNFEMPKFIQHPENLIQESLRAYYILLAAAVGVEDFTLPSAKYAKVFAVDGQDDLVFVHFRDNTGNIITIFEMAYSWGSWYVSDYRPQACTGLEVFNRYAGKQVVKFVDLSTLQDTLSSMLEVENRKMIRASSSEG